MSKDTISRERLEAPPGTIYAETILEPSHLFMLEHYFSPLASTNKAWTVMLVETGIVDEDRGAALLDAILDLEAAGPDSIGDFDPRYESFYSMSSGSSPNDSGRRSPGRSTSPARDRSRSRVSFSARACSTCVMPSPASAGTF